MNRFRFAALAIIAMPGLAAAAYDSYPDSGGVYLGPVLETGFGFGGDTYAGGVRPGDSLDFALGLHLRPYRNSMFDTRFTVGISSAAADGSDTFIDATTWKLVPSIRLPADFRAGIGAELHSNIKYTSDTGYFPNTTFKSVVGPTFELGWHFHGGRHFDGGIMAFATLMQYEPEGGPDPRKINANTYGVRLSAALGWSAGGSEPNYMAPRMQSQAVSAPAATSNPWADTPAPSREPVQEPAYAPPPAPPRAATPAYSPPAPYTPPQQSNVGGTKRGAPVKAEPPAAPVAPPAPPAPSAKPAAPVSADAHMRTQAPLRSKPALESPGKQILGVGAPLRLVTQLENDAGKWWYVETESGGNGWVRASEVQP